MLRHCVQCATAPAQGACVPCISRASSVFRRCQSVWAWAKVSQAAWAVNLVLPKMASLYLWSADLFCFHRLCSISASSQASTGILLSQLAFLSLCLATPQRLVPCPASPIPALYQVSRVNPSALPFSSLPDSHQVPEILMSVVATPLPSLLRGPFSTANVNDSHLPSK